MINILLAIHEIQDENERNLVSIIYNQYSLKIKSMAMGIVGNNHDAEEVLSDTFIRIIKYRHHFMDASPDEIKRLIIIYTRSACFDYCKKRNKTKVFSADEIYYDDDGNDYTCNISDQRDLLNDYINKETVQRISDMIDSMQSPAKEILQLRFYYQSKTTEIADILGINHSTVRSIIKRTVLKIKTKIEESEYEYQ